MHYGEKYHTGMVTNRLLKKITRSAIIPLLLNHAKILPKKRENLTKYRYIKKTPIHTYLNTQLCVYTFYICVCGYKNTVSSILIEASTN